MFSDIAGETKLVISCTDIINKEYQRFKQYLNDKNYDLAVD